MTDSRNCAYFNSFFLEAAGASGRLASRVGFAGALAFAARTECQIEVDAREALIAAARPGRPPSTAWRIWRRRACCRFPASVYEVKSRRSAVSMVASEEAYLFGRRGDCDILCARQSFGGLELPEEATAHRPRLVSSACIYSTTRCITTRRSVAAFAAGRP